MSKISVDVSSARIPVLQVGYQGENEVTDVLFDISSWITEFGEGVAQLRVKRPGNSEDESYVLSLIITDGKAVWTVSETDTANKGNGKVQLSYMVGNILKKAVIYPYKVGKSIVGADNPVDPFDSWIERSKAWSIGKTLDGGDVPETDETYQNNAKYYAEQADILGSAQVVLATEQATLATEKATLATEKAAAAAESETNAAASEAAVNGVSTQLTTRMSAIETEQAVQDARMDTFTSLPEGSTSGNAELADIRVGANGTTYDTAGNAVRGQIGELKSDIAALGEGGIFAVSLEYVSGYYNDYGEITEAEWASRTEMIDISDVDAIIFDGAYIDFPGGFTVFYKDGVRKYSISEGSLSRETIPYRVNTADYDGVKFSFNNTGLSNIVIKKEIKGTIANLKARVEKLETALSVDFAPAVIPDFAFPVNQPFVINKDNVVLHQSEQGIIDYQANDMTEKTFVLSQSNAGTHEYEHFVFDIGMTDYKTNVFNVEYKQPSYDAKTVLVIGDSTIDNSVHGGINLGAREVKAMKDSYGANLTLIGTRGDAPYRHCGIGGWRSTDFWETQSAGGNVNPFYNASVGHFDFQYFLTQNGFNAPDIVLIQLGINDVSASTSPARLGGLIDMYCDSMQKIVDNIKTASVGTKVYVNLIIPPSVDWNDYMAYAGAYLSPEIMKYNDMMATAEIMKRLHNIDGLLPTNCVIDRETDLADRVHPNDDGYAKLGHLLAYCLSVIN